MKNNLFSVLVLIFFFSLAAVEFDTTKDLPRLYNEHKSSTVSLMAGQAKDINGLPSFEFFSATGFVIDAEKGYIFTAGHFARDERVLFFNKIVMKQIKIDTDIECAIFQVDPLLLKNHKEVKLSIDVTIGDTIFVIGDPHQKKKVLTSGLLSKKNVLVPPLFNMGVLLTDALIVAGSSGSPVFNLKGEVIGCAVGHYDGFGLILPAQTIINFINSLND